MARTWSSPRTSVPPVRPGRSGMCAADSAICRSVAGASNASMRRRHVDRRRAEERVRHRGLPLPTRAREIADRYGPVRGSNAPRVDEEDAGPGREAGPGAVGGLERRGDTRRVRRHVWLDEAAPDQDERADGVTGPEDVRSGALRLGEEPV